VIELKVIDNAHFDIEMEIFNKKIILTLEQALELRHKLKIAINENYKKRGY
jgi:hypothetical protein